MNEASKYIEVREADYLIKKMWEDLFGHRMVQWSPKDTAKLHKNLLTPTTDKDKEDYLNVITPLMQKKSVLKTPRSKYLDAFLDLYTRVNPTDLEPTQDTDSDELDSLLGLDDGKGE